MAAMIEPATVAKKTRNPRAGHFEVFTMFSLWVLKE
jgi:hypothetical protein